MRCQLLTGYHCGMDTTARAESGYLARYFYVASLTSTWNRRGSLLRGMLALGLGLAMLVTGAEAKAATPGGGLEPIGHPGAAAERVVTEYLQQATRLGLHTASAAESGGVAKASNRYFADYRRLAPVILRSHDLAWSQRLVMGATGRRMASHSASSGGGRASTGGLLSQFDEGQRERLEDAWIRLMIGERVRMIETQGWKDFVLVSRSDLSGGLKLVWASIELTDGAKHSIGFILGRTSGNRSGGPLSASERGRDSAWRIINTLFGHFSELAERRVRFHRLVRNGGAEGLLTALDQRLERLQ